jgi:hypothetical protein
MVDSLQECYVGHCPLPEVYLFVLNIPQTMDNVQHSVPIVNQPLSQTFRELLS